MWYTKNLRFLQEALREMGFELGGEAGTRLGKKLSYPESPDTILRLVKPVELPAASSPLVVGLDDWSWKRRLRYGTLICDLESHHTIDVLPDWSVKIVSGWFKKHPSVEVVSRDRSSEYAAARKYNAPQATQIANRWHLGKNLTESVGTLLARCRAEIRRGLHMQKRAETQPVLEEEKYNEFLEGHVNRLKLIKRSMYGRAKLPLLRQRGLWSA